MLLPVLAARLAAVLTVAGQRGDTVPTIHGVVLDPRVVEQWVDSVVKPALATFGSPGAVVVVVQRSGIVLNKGYGVSDVANRTPFNADATLFQTASLGKTMTAVITNQLVDEGVLDLDEDINHYLKSAQVHGSKVTLRMLLGHRGGFDDDISGLLVPFDADPAMTRAELDRRLRPLVAPGYAVAYDNQGFGVIGLVLRDVTGKPIPELYRERLFDPVGMTNAVHGRPADGKARLARCYTVQGPGAVHECEYWLYRDGLRGAGGVAVTGADMARYMRMFLNGGTLDGKTILSPRAFADLTNFDNYRFHPGMPGGGRAFIQFEEFRGLEYAHSGSVPGFSSMMKIYPDADVAILVTFLGGQIGSFDLTVSNIFQALKDVNIQPAAKPGLNTLRELTDTFAGRFIPADRPRSSEGKAPPSASSAGRVEDYFGDYVIGSNHSRSLISRLGGWGGLVRLERAGDSSVRLGGDFSVLGDYRRVGPLLYENKKGDRIAMAELPVGRYMAVGLSGGVFKKTNVIESPGWSMPVVAIAILVLLTALIQLRPKAPPHLRTLARWSLLGLVLVLIGLLAETQWGVSLGIGAGAIVRPALWRLTLHAGALILIWQAIRFIRTRGLAIGRVSYAHGVLIAASGASVFVVLLAWRVLGAFPPYWYW
ncbi:MAG: serine hydrolase domain-containing protein [Gemmatimonadota bacterium]